MQIRSVTARSFLFSLALTVLAQGSVVSGAPETKTVEPKAVSAESAAPAAIQDKSGRVIAALRENLLQWKDSGLSPVPANQLDGVRFLAVYYSAQWCPPCRAFTPELVAAYKEIKAKHPEFELVFVSSDRNEKAMEKYMSDYQMPWPAVMFDRRKSVSVLARPDYENGIPNLVFMDANGKEIATSFTPDGKYLGPREVLAKIMRQFKM